MCSGVVWRIMTASYMWIEVRMMCMRPRHLLVVVRRLYDVYFPLCAIRPYYTQYNAI